MFTKEFLFQEILEIWDLILQNTNNTGFYMMDLIALSMMIWIRDFGR